MKDRRNRKGIILFAFIAFVFLTATSSFAGTTTYQYFDDPAVRKITVTRGTQPPATFYSVSGIVTDNNSNPISGVTVTLGASSTTTDSNGFYGFSGLSNGTYTVTPSKNGYSFQPSSIQVTVSNADAIAENFTGTATSFTVTPSAGANGSISPNTPQTVNSGSTVAFTVTPNTGYNISSVKGCNGGLNGNIYTTGAISLSCKVSATFAAVPSYTATPSTGANGSISPSTPQTVFSGSTTSFTVTPNTGYHIASVTGCNGSLSGSTYTIGAMTENCTVSATFAINTYTVTPSVTGGGTINPATPQTVNYNSTVSFMMTPNTGYLITLVSGTCGGNLSGNTYMTNQITSDCTVIATFSTMPPVRIARATPLYFSSLQTAYNSAVNGDVIQSMNGALTENVTFNNNISVTLQGGYDGSYTSIVGMTKIVGAVSVTGGTVTAGGIIVSN